MKKYFLGLTAIVLAIGFSAFTKAKFVNDILKPTAQPTSTNIIADETKWADYGTGVNGYNCTSTTTQDVGCRILADAKYTHDDGSGLVLNVAGNTPPGEFQLTVTETTGLSSGGIQYYKILNVTSNDASDSKGNGFDFVNAVK